MTKSFLLILALFCAAITKGQSFKENIIDRQTEKDDPMNEYRSDDISSLEISQAFAILGMHIYKFNLGYFDSTYKIIVSAEEFVNGKVVKTDTLLDDLNTYTYFERGEKEYYKDYIDQIKIFAKQDKETFTIHLRTYGTEVRKSFLYTSTEKDQFYSWRSYSDTKWKLNKKVPLLIFASSWKDKNYGFQRFCGVVNLKENDLQTTELLTSSPRYYLISYKVVKQRKQ